MTVLLGLSTPGYPRSSAMRGRRVSSRDIGGLLFLILYKFAIMDLMNNNKPLNFILIGRSGSGKGTQAELLAKKFKDLIHISTGELMRDLTKRDTEVGVKIKKILEKGGLPFDDMATTLWMHEIAFSVKKDQGIICDGFPRRVNEAQNLDRFFEWLGRNENTKVLEIDISREEAFTRLKKRARGIDDNDEAINGRLSYFEERVVPVINFYKERGQLIHINGEQSVEDVFKEIIAKIND